VKVYVLTRYWDNDEMWRENLLSQTTVEKVFATKAAGVKYLKTISVTDILSNDCWYSEGWYIDESEEIHTDSDSGIVTRSFHARKPYEGANIEFTLEEKEVEE
jgi:hypothetical protein